VICEAVQAYLEKVDDRELAHASDELRDEWFRAFDEAAHIAYEHDPPRRLARLGAWLRRTEKP
jgi:hypothetical protein